MELIISGNSIPWIILVVLTSLWLFKEIRIFHLKNMDIEIERRGQVLKVYGNLEFNILRYLETEEKEILNSLHEAISNSYSFLSRNIFKKCEEYYNNRSKDKLEELLVLLREEISSIHHEQSEKIDAGKKYAIDYYMQYLDSFFIPGVMTVVAIVQTLFGIYLGLEMIHPQIEWYQKLWTILRFISANVLILLAYSLLNVISNKNLEIELKNWFYIIFAIVSFFLTLYMDYLSIIYFAFLIYFVFFKFKKMIKHRC
ncbi:hypothetical protein [Alkaliphilus oremlandii]|nr:hypothetical protein [Alkaliphilus oremlandii]